MCMGFMLLFALPFNSHGKDTGWIISGGKQFPLGVLNSGPGQQPLGLPDVSEQKRRNNTVDV